MREPEFIAQFERDIAGHRLEIVKDDGLYRHLRFRRPGTYCMGFDIVTFPGWLVYVGDMGCYTFTRLADMMEFFRQPANNLYGQIDRRYWAEKCHASDKHDGIQEFSREAFAIRAREVFTEVIEDFGLTDEQKAEALESMEIEVIQRAEDDGEAAAFSTARDFQVLDPRTGKNRAIFVDSWEWNCRVYTQRFNWCCCALAWGIAQYDAAKAKPAANDSAPAQAAA